VPIEHWTKETKLEQRCRNLVAFAQSWKTPISFITSVLPSVLLDESVRFPLVESLWNLILWIFMKMVKIEQKFSHWTWRTKCIVLLAAH